MQIPSLAWEDPGQEGMATHSSILAWRIPWTGELGSYSSKGCKESDTTEVTSHEPIVWISHSLCIHLPIELIAFKF